jgi:uncharacterized membrane protein
VDSFPQADKVMAMHRVVLKDIRLERTPFAGFARKVHHVLFGLFLAQFTLVWAKLWLLGTPFGNAKWPDGLLVVLATATLLASLTLQLPGQNVILASVVIAASGGAVHAIGALTGIPFGPYVYSSQIGQQLFSGLPWAVPMVWIIVILSSRGVARLVLRPWRNTQNYGFSLIGLTAALVVWLDFGLEPFATQVKHFWRWNPTKIRSDWYGAPWVNFFGWMVTALLILAFVTPSLINKRPVKQPPPDYHPLIVWLLLNLLFATGSGVLRLWMATWLITAGSALAVFYALRGARAKAVGPYSGNLQ